MKKQNLKLENIKISSFVTNVNGKILQTIKGGSGPINGCSDFICATMGDQCLITGATKGDASACVCL